MCEGVQEGVDMEAAHVCVCVYVSPSSAFLVASHSGSALLLSFCQSMLRKSICMSAHAGLLQQSLSVSANQGHPSHPSCG